MIADAELVQRCRDRDTAAFGELVERHQRLVFGVALARCGDAALAEDLAQEAFVTAWRDLDRLRDHARIGSWVAGIARNLAASAARTRTRHATPPELAQSPVPTPEDALLEREDRDLLARALADVPGAHREVLVLYYLEGRSIAQIALTLGVRDDLVKQRLSRGRRALREGVGDRVETAVARVRAKPALRAGVLAALATLPARKAAAAPVAGKVFVLASQNKIIVAAGIVAIASGAAWIGTRSHRDTARANAVAAPTWPQATAPHVRRIDPDARTQLLDEIRRTAHEREGKTPLAVAGATPSSSATLRPSLADAPEFDKEYIRAAVRDLVPLLDECYGEVRERIPHLKGWLVVDFTIEGEPGIGGVVSASRIDDANSDLTDPAFRECVQETMYALEIDPPASGGVVSFKYPFGFDTH
jgi:RNA polymerase sigma factor (sigma-70 family)